MELFRKGVTITWEIENVMYFLKKHAKFCSPAILVDEMEGTKWRLELEIINFGTVIGLSLRRESEDNGPEELELDYKFSATPSRGEPLTENRKYSCTFTKGLNCPQVEWPEGHMFQSIIVRCQMWPQRRYISKNCHFVIQTPVEKDRRAFVGIVENFSDLSTGVVKKLKTVSLSKGKEPVMVNLSLHLYRGSFRKKTGVSIEVISLNEETDPFFGFKVIFLDSSNKKTKFGKMENYFISKTSNRFMLPATKECITEKKFLFSPNDTLSLRCEVTFYNVEEHKISKTIESETYIVSDSGASSSAVTDENEECSFQP